MGELSLLDEDEAAGFMALLRSLNRILWRVLPEGLQRHTEPGGVTFGARPKTEEPYAE